MKLEKNDEHQTSSNLNIFSLKMCLKTNFMKQESQICVVDFFGGEYTPEV